MLTLIAVLQTLDICCEYLKLSRFALYGDEAKKGEGGERERRLWVGEENCGGQSGRRLVVTSYDSSLDKSCVLRCGTVSQALL
ncbi:MAG: hypothetical protein ACKERG_04675 [Candidatus Hodgkinia cicadicola]